VTNRFSEEDKETIWDMREAGVPVKRIAKHLDRQNSSLRRFIADHGGRRPTPRERSELRLSLEEREEISRGLAGGLSLRAIAAGLERSPSTICREVNANGGPKWYRALQADRAALKRAPRPKRAKLAQCRRLRSTVERKLEAWWSPQQISSWLAETYPDNPEMQVSHETIYQSLFVQSRGALRKELRCEKNCSRACGPAGPCPEPRPTRRAALVGARSPTRSDDLVDGPLYRRGRLPGGCGKDAEYARRATTEARPSRGQRSAPTTRSDHR